MTHKFIMFCLCAGLAMTAAAQTGRLSGTLSGISQNTGMVVIVLTNSATGAVQRVNVNPDGSFMTNLPPGTYKVEIEREGQRTSAGRDLEIAPGINSQTTLQVSVGPATETLEIAAQAPAVQDQPDDIGRGLTTRTVRELPVQDRNYQELNGLLNGVTPPTTSASRTLDPQRGREYNTNGLPAFANDNLSDGSTIRDPFTGILSVRVLPDEAVEQLNVHTSNYPADSGMAAGALTNVFTRPGTNGIHGSAFEFTTNDFFQAHSGLAPAAAGEPRLHHNQYGGSIGGALMPDKMFLFLSYEGTRDNSSSPQFATVPTSEMLGGNFSGLGVTLYDPASGTPAGIGRTPLPGSMVTSINPLSSAIASNFPAPNLPGFANNYASEVPYYDSNNVGDAKLDYRFSDALTGFLRYGISHLNTSQGSIFGNVIGSPTNSGLRNHHASISLVGNYHGILGELRFGYSRYRNAVYDTSTLTPSLNSALTAAGFTGGTLPTINISGIGQIGTPAGLPSKDLDNIYDGSANFHIYRGVHQIAFGADARGELADGWSNVLYSPFGPLGAANPFTFGAFGGFGFEPGPASSATALSTNPNAVLASSFASFLAGAPTTAGVFHPSVLPSFRQTQIAGYVLDTVHVGNKLVVDIGVRYDAYSPVATRHPFDALFLNSPTGGITAGNELYHGNWDANNVAPRVGVAYRFRESTVFRAGYSINYFPLPFALSGLNFAGTGALEGISGSFAPARFVLPSVPGGSATSAPNLPFYISSANQAPYTQNYYAQIQHDLRGGFLFDVSYIGNVGRQFPYIAALNAAAPGSGLAGLPFLSSGITTPITAVGQGLTSNYNALQVNLSKQLSKGASFNVAYTWSKALDHGLVLFNPASISGNYGPADWDRTQMLTISHLFALPVGRGSPRWNQGFVGQLLANWELAGLFHWATGTPYNVTTDPLACACPGNSMILANPLPGASSVNGAAFPNPSFFAPATPGSFGTLGRNAVRGPDLTAYNLSLFKSFAVRENYKVELRAEAYNLLNNTQYANPVSNISLASFGQQIATFNGTGGRLFVLGARVLF